MSTATLHRPETDEPNELNEPADGADLSGGEPQTGIVGPVDPAPDQPAQSPDELRRQHYDDMIALGRQVAEAKSRAGSLKAEAAEAKKEYEGLQSAFLNLSRRDPMQRPLPLGEPGQSDEPLPPETNWRPLDVNVLDIAPGALDKLYQAGIFTLGDLSDYWKAGKQLADIKGIGEASDSAIRDAFSEYGVEHPEIFGEQPAGAEGDEEGGE